jgi:FecR-like protein
MSEDRLERALQQMKEEDVRAGTLEAARARVWEKVTNPGSATCAELRQEFRAYLNDELRGGRRMLVEDHLGRCAACRSSMADMKGERRVIAMPQRSSNRWMRRGALGAAAALILSVMYVGRGTIDAWLAPGGPRATVVSATGGVYRLTGGALDAGAVIGERELVRTGPGARAVLRLADGSTVDVNQRTELFVTAAWSGRAIHLQRGDVIVQAAKQRRGHLRVLTRDSIASVKGTVFAVSAGMGGSVVSVVEGAVAVDQPGRNVVLSPGQQAASNPALATTVAEAVSWSPESDAYLELLASFVKIEGQLAGISSGELRTSSTLLSYLPSGAFVYGAVPNLGGKIAQVLTLAEQQALENAVFRTWWNSETGLELRQIVERTQSVSSLLGDEIVFSIGAAGPGDEVPMVLARVQPGKRAELANVVEGFFAEAGQQDPAYSVTDELMVASDSAEHLTWALAHLGQGAGSPFAAAIGDRYRRGAGWLIAVDAAPVIEMASGDDAPPIELAAMVGVKYLFLEQRAPAGAEENEVTLAFQGPRTGMASWLADAGSGGAAEYLPADALLAGYVSMREPSQLFQEFTALMTQEHESFESEMAEVNEKLGPSYLQDLTGALGTEGAFALNGFSVNGPTWVITALVYNPTVIDGSLRKLMDAFNAELAPDEQDKRILLEQETAGGRVWSTMKGAGLPIGITWTYDRGFMVAASDRASAEHAIATRNGGSPLVWSQEFLAQLPSSAGIHPSAFAWLNTKGAFGLFSGLATSPALQELLAARDPALVVFDGTAEQIHAVSRARLTGLIMDMMLLKSLSGTLESQTAQQ